MNTFINLNLFRFGLYFCRVSNENNVGRLLLLESN